MWKVAGKYNLYESEDQSIVTAPGMTQMKEFMWEKNAGTVMMSVTEFVINKPVQ